MWGYPLHIIVSRPIMIVPFKGLTYEYIVYIFLLFYEKSINFLKFFFVLMIKYSFYVSEKVNNKSQKE